MNVAMTKRSQIKKWSNEFFQKRNKKKETRISYNANVKIKLSRVIYIPSDIYIYISLVGIIITFSFYSVYVSMNALELYVYIKIYLSLWMYYNNLLFYNILIPIFFPS